MKKLDLNNEVGSTLLIIKKNSLAVYFNLIMKIFFLLLSILSGAMVGDMFSWRGLFGVVLAFIFFLVFDNLHQKAKEKYIIISKGNFILKTSKSKTVQEINFWDYRLKSVSIKKGEVILLSEVEFPWGNRKVFLSDDYFDRKDEVLNLLKSNIY
jgi:hypothetical protein